jgi:hypothetical protein
MRNNLPERSARGKRKFLAKNYSGYFDEKAKKENILYVACKCTFVKL